MIASYSVLGIGLYLFKESRCSVQIKRKNDRSPRYPFARQKCVKLCAVRFRNAVLRNDLNNPCIVI